MTGGPQRQRWDLGENETTPKPARAAVSYPVPAREALLPSFYMELLWHSLNTEEAASLGVCKAAYRVLGLPKLQCARTASNKSLLAGRS